MVQGPDFMQGRAGGRSGVEVDYGSVVLARAVSSYIFVGGI